MDTRQDCYLSSSAQIVGLLILLTGEEKNLKNRKLKKRIEGAIATEGQGHNPYPGQPTRSFRPNHCPALPF